MKTPYPEPSISVRELAVLCHQWNTANQRAHDEYMAHPTAACIQPDCHELSETSNRNNCPERARANKRAAERMRLRRRGGDE